MRGPIPTGGRRGNEADFMAGANSAFGTSAATGVGHQSEEKEKSAEDVLAFGRPGDGFDVERMQREESSHNHRAPDCAGRSVQEKKEKDCVRDVK